jgi:hypothetical protein
MQNSRPEIGRVNKPIGIILKYRLLMACTACLVCLVSTVSGCHHRDKTKVQMPEKIFPHFKVKC